MRLHVFSQGGISRENFEISHERRARRRDLAEAVLLIALALFLNSGALALRTQEGISDKIIRLHVLANSDSPADQDLKPLVRDAVLNHAEELLRNARNRQEAEAILRDQLPELARLGESVVREHGCDYPVTAELRETEFPTRAYDNFTLPAGRYLALRVLIGRGEGRNWWCVVFPPLCGASAVSENHAAGDYQDYQNYQNYQNRRDYQDRQDTASGAMASVFSAQEIRLITEDSPEIIFKFRVVELWESIRRTLSD